MFRLPPLPYAYDALAPVISERTLRTHHGKHHAKYVENTNAILAARGGAYPSLEAVVADAARRDDAALFNNAGQALNHAFFWACMTPRETAPTGTLLKEIEATFSSVAALKERFVTAGAGHFGSGWVWLVARRDGLAVVSTHDGDTAFRDGWGPLLVCDLWEHAYYLDHLNDRAGFLAAWWDACIDWEFVAEQHRAAMAGAAAWTYAGAQAEAPQTA